MMTVLVNKYIQASIPVDKYCDHRPIQIDGMGCWFYNHINPNSQE